MSVAQRLRTLGIASALGFCALYLVFDLTRIGEYWDDEAHLGREMFQGQIHHVLNRFLDMINVGSIVVMIVLVVAIAAVRRIYIVSAVVLGSFLLTVGLAELLKRVLPRREFGSMDETLRAFEYNTFPSGHATIATAFVIAIVLLANTSWRPWVATFGSLWVCLIASGVLAAGWHRPSDALAGICLASAGMSLAAAIAIPRWFVDAPRPRSSRWLWLAGLLVVVMTSSLLAVLILSPATAQPESRRVLGDFLKASIAIDALAVLVVCVVAWLIRSVVAARAGLERSDP